MINYYIKTTGLYVKVDTETEVVDLVLNIQTQKTLSKVDNPEYYQNTLELLSGWTISDQVTYETNKNTVLQALNAQ